MALLLTNEGEERLLATALGKLAQENLILKLFTSDTTPAESDTAVAYTEAAGGGYASVTLTGASWTLFPGSPTGASYPQITFSFSGALTGNGSIYGYYIVGATSGKVWWAERFSAPFVPAASRTLRITPVFELE